MNSFIGWIGGKRALRKDILALFPENIAVSYTHLDVYKRQTLDRPVLEVIDGALSAVLRDYEVSTVSYTHLDVYKRQ